MPPGGQALIRLQGGLPDGAVARQDGEKWAPHGAKPSNLPTGKALRLEGCAWALTGSAGGLRKRRQIQTPNQMLHSASCPPHSRPHPHEGHGISLIPAISPERPSVASSCPSGGLWSPAQGGPCCPSTRQGLARLDGERKAMPGSSFPHKIPRSLLSSWVGGGVRGGGPRPTMGTGSARALLGPLPAHPPPACPPPAALFKQALPPCCQPRTANWRPLVAASGPVAPLGTSHTTPGGRPADSPPNLLLLFPPGHLMMIRGQQT